VDDTTAWLKALRAAGVRRVTLEIDPERESPTTAAPPSSGLSAWARQSARQAASAAVQPRPPAPPAPPAHVSNHDDAPPAPPPPLDATELALQPAPRHDPDAAALDDDEAE
jgi:hypothetical protein